MRFTVERKVFSEALGHVNSVVPTQTPRPLLQNARLVAESGRGLTLSGSDFEASLSITIDAVIEENGEILLPTGKLYNLVKRLDCAKLEFSVKEAIAHITGGGGKFTLAGCGGEDFPILPEAVPDNAVSVNGSAFAKAVSRAAACTSRNHTGVYACGVFLCLENDSLEIVGTDTHREAYTKIKTNSAGAEWSGIVMPRGLALLAKLASSTEGVEAGMSNAGFIARAGGALVCLRLLDASYVTAYRHFAMPTGKKSFTTKREDMLRAVEAAAVLSCVETRKIVLCPDESRATLSAEDAAYGGGDIEIGVIGDKSGVPIALNHSFLAEGLRAMEGDEVKVFYSGDRDPVAFHESGFTYTLSPLGA